VSKILPYIILHKEPQDITWKEFIRYETKREAISYLENVNPTLRPALISFGQQTLRAYDSGIIDYELINQNEEIIIALRNRHYSALIAVRDNEKDYPETAKKYQFLADELEAIIKSKTIEKPLSERGME